MWEIFQQYSIIRQCIKFQNIMNKQVRNRRSASSCSNYSQHSVSLINLEAAGEAASKQPTRERKIEYGEIQRLFLVVHQELKKYTTSATEELLVEKQIILKWRKTLKVAIEQGREYHRNITNIINTLKSNLTQAQQSKETEIKNIQVIQAEEFKLKQNEMSKKIIDLNGEFSRKEQQYKDIISKFIDTLHKSQSNWSKIHMDLSGRLKKAGELFKQRVEIDNKNHQIYEQITHFTNEVYGQHDQSLGSINLSYDELVFHLPVRQLESRRNTIDISSIQQIYEDEAEHTRSRWGLEDCLIQLIHWGFFLQKNQGNIKKLISITKDLENPEQIVKQPIFPILIESIKLQLNFDKEMNSIVEDNSQIYYEGQDRVIMRDIENELD